MRPPGKPTLSLNIIVIDKGFIVELAKSHTPANKRWRITAAGVDDLDRRGL